MSGSSTVSAQRFECGPNLRLVGELDVRVPHVPGAVGVNLVPTERAHPCEQARFATIGVQLPDRLAHGGLRDLVGRVLVGAEARERKPVRRGIAAAKKDSNAGLFAVEHAPHERQVRHQNFIRRPNDGDRSNCATFLCR